MSHSLRNHGSLKWCYCITGQCRIVYSIIYNVTYSRTRINLGAHDVFPPEPEARGAKENLFQALSYQILNNLLTGPDQKLDKKKDDQSREFDHESFFALKLHVMIFLPYNRTWEKNPTSKVSKSVIKQGKSWVSKLFLLLGNARMKIHRTQLSLLTMFRPLRAYITQRALRCSCSSTLRNLAPHRCKQMLVSDPEVAVITWDASGYSFPGCSFHFCPRVD